VKNAWEIVIRLRPVIVVAAFAFVLLSLPSQILELYLIDIETVRGVLIKEVGGDWKPSWQLLRETLPIQFAMAAGAITMLVLWLCSAHLICLNPERAKLGRGHQWLARVLVIAIALAPISGVLSGLNNIRIGLPQIAPGNTELLRPDVLQYMRLSAILLGIAAVALSVVTFIWLEGVAAIARALFSRWGTVAGLGSILLITAAIVVWPTVLPWGLGTQALVYVFLAALAFVLTWLSDVYRRTGWPVTVMVVAAALVFSWMGWSDNHKVEYKVGNTPPAELSGSFVDWLMSRGDRSWYAERSKAYPVYIVAAEGGGMYAGYHVAAWLGKLQDACPGFAQHTFAISSVSGGSLGAGVFSTLAHRLATNGEHQGCTGGTGRFTQVARKFFENDLLAPLVGAALFPDFLQRLLPIPFKALDRARALEEAFSVAWDRSVSVLGEEAKGAEGMLKQSIQSVWSPTGAAPALFLNTTSVAAGSRVTISPVWFNQTSTALHVATTLCDNLRSVELSLVSAISLSARFPWLTPAGWLDTNDAGRPCPAKQERNRVYLVDGAYFENSGLETAIEMATYMRLYTSDPEVARVSRVDLDKIRAEYPHGIDIRIIMIFAVDDFASRYIRSEAERTSDRPGELLPPIQTMLAGRAARTRAVHLHALHEGFLPYRDEARPRSARYDIQGSRDIWIGDDGVHQVPLDGTKFFLPLGWRLSQRSMQTIGENKHAPSTLAFQLVQHELEGKSTDELKGRER
jgi:hypothetical protein